MRHRYDTQALVLSRAPFGEASALVTLLTPTLGLLYARAQGVRQAGAKLAPALATLAQSRVIVVRGKEGWRVAGALLEDSWMAQLARPSARGAAGRITGLLLRLVAGESINPELFSITQSFFLALCTLPDEQHEAAEILAALRILHTLGLDAGDIPGAPTDFSEVICLSVIEERIELIKRINAGISASGL